ncbi:sodium/calcium exchanger 3-like, partial [Rhagoletis pomonella]|uniref:sodium/calcium exchanger 3-like n=1 Tax=Rhagoletis pomonella TaxID=28610 RepID=UPI001784179D
DPLYSRVNEVKLKRDEERTNRVRILVSGQPKLSDDIKQIECHIIANEEFTQTVNKLVQTANASKLIGTTSWKEQFVDALTVSDSGDFNSEENNDEDEVEIDEDEDIEEKIGPSRGEYFMHFISMFWKICFAVIPPATICTAVLGDVSSHFGCTLGVLDSVTAICFVALGTSMP